MPFNLSAECPRNAGIFPYCSTSFEQSNIGKSMAYAINRSPPKAEATGSNPVGCANKINHLCLYHEHDGHHVSAPCQLAWPHQLPPASNPNPRWPRRAKALFFHHVNVRTGTVLPSARAALSPPPHPKPPQKRGVGFDGTGPPRAT